MKLAPFHEIRHCTFILKETENRMLISRGLISGQINDESGPEIFSPLTSVFSLSSNRMKRAKPFPRFPFRTGFAAKVNSPRFKVDLRRKLRRAKFELPLKVYEENYSY